MPLLSQTTSIPAHQGTSTTLSCLSLDNPPLQHNALLQRGFQTLSMRNRPMESRGNFNKLFSRWNYRVTGIIYLIIFVHVQELKVYYWQRSLAAWREASTNSIEDVAFCCKLLHCVRFTTRQVSTTGDTSQCHIHPAFKWPKVIDIFQIPLSATGYFCVPALFLVGLFSRPGTNLFAFEPASPS